MFVASFGALRRVAARSGSHRRADFEAVTDHGVPSLPCAFAPLRLCANFYEAMEKFTQRRKGAKLSYGDPFALEIRTYV
ncbi:MAG: hypothetical protein IPF53_08900 [Blastocatellia bacterium]|nr:hypothetical protein [Blastocatellia bacterium]MBK6427345.1 hypothetical protein [Blastocatellia bacterium]